jgi:hypothetical protein
MDVSRVFSTVPVNAPHLPYRPPLPLPFCLLGESTSVVTFYCVGWGLIVGVWRVKSSRDIKE